MTETVNTAAVSEHDIKNKKEKELLVVQDLGHFVHDTLDTYDGYFEAKKKDRSLKMHGVGTYKTAEGDTYTGVWDNDKLGANEKVTIEYNEGSKYEGPLKDWCYNSHGKYTYPDETVLQCDFVENTPVGNLELTDPNGHVWLGKAAQGFGWFNPVNHYYEVLGVAREVHKIRRPSAFVPATVAPESTTKGNNSFHIL